MQTVTKLATSSITNTKLAVLTLVALAAAGVALAVTPVNNQTITTKVKSCTSVNNVVSIINSNDCVGNKSYNYSCLDSTTLATQTWPCKNLPDLAFTQPPVGEGVEFVNSTNNTDNTDNTDKKVLVRCINNGKAKATTFPTILIQWLGSDMSTVLKSESGRGSNIPNPGNISSNYFNVNASTPLNAKYLRVSLDPQNVIKESNKDNNLATKEIPTGFLVTEKALPDISFVPDAWGTGGGVIYKDTANLGKYITVQNTNKIQGTSYPNISNGILVQWLDKNKKLLSESRRDLGVVDYGKGGGTPFILPDGVTGISYANVTLDPDNKVKESDEGNNSVMYFSLPGTATINIISPLENTNISGIQEVIVTAVESDIANVRIYVDDAFIGNATFNKEKQRYYFNWDTSKTTDGKHKISAVVTNSKGEKTTFSEARMVTVKNTAVAKTCADLAADGSFNNCKDYSYICFNKYTGEYQGCSKEGEKSCTENNINAANNIKCAVATTAKTCADLAADTKSFNICQTAGYSFICFDKYTGEYQGCSKDGNGCTNMNAHADRNVQCAVR